MNYDKILLDNAREVEYDDEEVRFQRAIKIAKTCVDNLCYSYFSVENLKYQFLLTGNIMDIRHKMEIRECRFQLDNHYEREKQIFQPPSKLRADVD